MAQGVDSEYISKRVLHSQELVSYGINIVDLFLSLTL